MLPTRAAITLGLVIIAAIVFDLVFFGGDTLLFLARKFVQLLEWLAFWR